MAAELKTKPKVVGVRQVSRALKKGEVRQVFLATNADPQMLSPLREECAGAGVPVDESLTMQELGSACGIAVSAAAAALLK